MTPRPANDDHQDEIYLCPGCSNTAFILQSAPGDSIKVKCGKCFADVTMEVARLLGLPTCIVDVSNRDIGDY